MSKLNIGSRGGRSRGTTTAGSRVTSVASRNYVSLTHHIILTATDYIKDEMGKVKLYLTKGMVTRMRLRVTT